MSHVPLTVFCVYPTGPNEWRWHLIDGRQRIVALAAQHFRSEEDCLAAVLLIKRSATAPVEITCPSRPTRFG